ncbi:unnamed protein product [Gordionus sp. m RMFG-2023]|uniref:uncharacterized protein LOC135926936 n=1 Tax=Gordionus sp. m RMFG-2023 TaxID=3053472 RepID=UPI0030E3B20A
MRSSYQNCLNFPFARSIPTTKSILLLIIIYYGYCLTDDKTENWLSNINKSRYKKCVFNTICKFRNLSSNSNSSGSKEIRSTIYTTQYENDINGKENESNNTRQNVINADKYPPNYINKVFNKYPVKAKSPITNEFLRWNEKCTEVSFHQTLTVDADKDFAGFKDLKGKWECDTANITNKFCFGICRTFKYPIEADNENDGLYKIKFVETGRENIKIKTYDVIKQKKGQTNNNKLDNFFENFLLSQYSEQTYQRIPISRNTDKNNNVKNNHTAKNGKYKRDLRYNKETVGGFFCSACVPQKAKYQDIYLMCRQVHSSQLATPFSNDINDKLNLHKEINCKNCQDKNIHKSMIVDNNLVNFLNKYGINPSKQNVSAKTYTKINSDISNNNITKNSLEYRRNYLQRNKIIDIDNKEIDKTKVDDLIHQNKNMMMDQKYLLVTKRVLIIDKCECQSCSKHDKYL